MKNDTHSCQRWFEANSVPFTRWPLEITGTAIGEHLTEGTDPMRTPSSNAGRTLIPGHHIPLNDSMISRFLFNELSTRRLLAIYSYLWMCGRRRNVHPLHWQLLIGRTVRVTEDPALHLVWTGGIIYMKPLPRCLLDAAFWDQWICRADGTSASSSMTAGNAGPPAPAPWPRQKSELWREANGLLMTYTRLIRHQSDHRIAIDLGLLPSDMDWMQWSRILYELDASPIVRDPSSVSPRYRYGELRLARLNLVYRVFRLEMRGFHRVDRDYSTFFTGYFAWILVLFAYASVLMTAFQTAIAVDGAPAIVQAAAYYSGVVVLCVTGLGVFVQVAIFVIMVLANLVWTLCQSHH